ncbi:MAG: hypothetical protein K8I30_17450, partial [Anaerolineae bacterium]|nr:hypothetical protein [Anaerolineae bacterium]
PVELNRFVRHTRDDTEGIIVRASRDEAEKSLHPQRLKPRGFRRLKPVYCNGCFLRIVKAAFNDG